MDNTYYDYLANDYNLKRKKPWNALAEFLEDINRENLGSSGYCLDLGCGNGRNFPLYSSYSNHIIGLDNSIELLKKVQKNVEAMSNEQKKGLNHTQLILSSLKSLPIRSNVIHSVFMIAVIHHIKGIDNRNAIMEQIYDVIKGNGWLIISVWRRFQKRYKNFFIKDFIKRKVIENYSKEQEERGLSEYGDKFIPWTLSKEGKTYQRFYHFFSYREAKNLMEKFIISITKKLGGPNKKDNYFFLAKK